MRAPSGADVLSHSLYPTVEQKGTFESRPVQS
jgi:hypothetical protein